MTASRDEAGENRDLIWLACAPDNILIAAYDEEGYTVHVLHSKNAARKVLRSCKPRPGGHDARLIENCRLADDAIQQDLVIYGPIALMIASSLRTMPAGMIPVQDASDPPGIRSCLAGNDTGDSLVALRSNGAYHVYVIYSSAQYDDALEAHSDTRTACPIHTMRCRRECERALPRTSEWHSIYIEGSAATWITGALVHANPRLPKGVRPDLVYHSPS